MKSILRPPALTLMRSLGVHHLSRWMNRHRLLAVMYHGLKPVNGKTNSWLLVSVDAFERQLRYLKKYYDVVSVSEAAQVLERGERFDRPTCCLTFDDGYRNNYTLGWPLLKKYGLPATIYLATDLIGTNQIHWTVKLEQAFLTTPVQVLDLSDLDLPTYDVRRDPSACTDLTARIYRCHDEDRERVLHAAFKRLKLSKDFDFSDFLPMSWAEAEEMYESGLVEFGGHTRSHAVVSALDDDQLQLEIAGSMTDISDRFGAPATSFAYPNGTINDFDERAKATVRETGAKVAFSTIRGLNEIDRDLFELRRVHVCNRTSLTEFQMATSGVLATLRSILKPGTDQRTVLPVLATITST